MADIYLAVDAGGSQTKIVAMGSGSNQRTYLSMPPHVEEISRARLANFFDLRGWMGSPAPDRQIWLEIEGRYYVVGALASEFDPEDRIRELKYENALYKVLAAISVMAETLKLPNKENLTVQLAILLPWNEYNDRHRFKARLEQLLSNYSSRRQKFKVKLERFICRPEGGGLAATWIRSKGTDWLQKRNLAVLMFGHRNLTALVFENGQLKPGDSPLIGFSTMLERVISMTSGLNRDELADALFKGMFKARTQSYNKHYSYHQHPEWYEDAIKALATAKDAALREAEVADIVKAIEVATSEYWGKVERWLNKVLPGSVDAVIVGGGAAYYLEPELEKYFNCEPEKDSNLRKTGRYKARDYNLPKPDLIWLNEIKEKVEKTAGFSFDEERQQNLSFRFLDCYGLFDYMVELAEHAQKQIEAEEKARAEALSEAKKEEAKRKRAAKRGEDQQKVSEKAAR